MIYADPVELQNLAPGLWRWTAPHPEWEEPQEEDSPADWPRDVGCVAYGTPGTLVLIDPLVDGDHAQLDELAQGKDAVAILTTLPFHKRSSEELAKRYDAASTPPEGVEALPIDGAGETMFWIAEHRALVPGDRVLGDRPPGLRLCPDSWLRYLNGYTRDDLRLALRRQLLDLPVDMVLVSHGSPVLSDGRAELEQALA
jgi:hypothetical protein